MRKVWAMKILPLFLSVALAGAALPASAANMPPPKPLALPKPVAPPTMKQMLDALFASLAKTHSEEDAKPIEEQIEQVFLQSSSATIDLLMTRAATALQGGDSDTAKQLLDYVTDIAPDYAEGWHQRGRMEMDAHDDEHALVSYQKTVTLNPREFVAQAELGDIFLSYNQKPAALAAFRKALALDPHFEGLDKRVEQLSREVEGEKI
jgi:tetratricopeptide (TPR) repeat protein